MSTADKFAAIFFRTARAKTTEVETTAPGTGTVKSYLQKGALRGMRVEGNFLTLAQEHVPPQNF
jgi:hypothetical protein